MIDYIENCTYDELKIGDTASLSKTLELEDIKLFAVLSGDVNPAHLDPEYAKDDIFHKIVGHGMWGGALVSAVLGTKLPGPGTIYLGQSLKFLKPVAIGDTITVSVTVTSKKDEKNIVELSCSCVNQDGKEVISGNAIVIAPREKVKRKRIELPKVILAQSRGVWYRKLIDLTHDFAPLITAIVHPVDEASLTGAIAAAEDKLIKPILIGPVDKIHAIAKSAHIDISTYEIVAVNHSTESAAMAVQMARDGKVEAIMKGKIQTTELMMPVVDRVNGLRTGRRMSHVFAMDIPYYSKPLFITDAALNISPTLMDKKDIIQNAINLFTAIGLGIPKVAIISAEETVNEKILSTLDGASLCKMAERGQITGGIVDGPLSFDLAISKEAARIKGIISEVVGDADIIVAPEINAGNILYKQMTYLTGSEAAGIVVGAKVPIILTSRGSDELSRKASCALALLFVHKPNGE